MKNSFSQPDLAAMDLAIADCLRKFNTHSYVDVDTRAFTQRLGVAACFFDVLRCQDIDALEQKLTVLDGVTAFRATDKLKTLRAATVLQAIADELHLKPFVPPSSTVVLSVPNRQVGPSIHDDSGPIRGTIGLVPLTTKPEVSEQLTTPATVPEARAKTAKPTPPPPGETRPARRTKKWLAEQRAKQAGNVPSKPADEPSTLDPLDDEPLPRREFVGIPILHEESGPVDMAVINKALDELNALKLAGNDMGMIAIGGTGDRVGEAIEAVFEPVIPQELATDPQPIETDLPSPPTSMSTQSGTPATKEVLNLTTIASFNQPSGVPSITLIPKGSAFRINQAAVQTLGLKQTQTVEFTRLDGRLFIRFDRPAGVGFPFQKSKTDQAGFSFSSRGLMKKLLGFLHYESTSELPISTTQSADGYELLLDKVVTKKRQS
ncbi:hypothetical protein FAES_3211 [Fibrella aestuarina BUZ 2]|uniref:Uncharacterized protein n=1 Tax=Fibrella aestuarina BUZ 2 TaxID=1166018 RepID=I0KAR7_9BACT|nr:hypothetical protein [Fibrella aestuarina]CCH01220.1 hypothetical protein FAES_3211 [Fibrella aestuarina BUZ 2]